MATAPLTFGDRLTAAGLTWEVSDARSHEPGPTLGEPRADLCPIDPDSGERISNVRIGRAERPYVRVNIRAGRSGDLELYPSSGYGTPLTDRQRAIILADLAGYRFELPPLSVPEIIEPRRPRDPPCGQEQRLPCRRHRRGVHGVPRAHGAGCRTDVAGGGSEAHERASLPYSTA